MSRLRSGLARGRHVESFETKTEVKKLKADHHCHHLRFNALGCACRVGWLSPCYWTWASAHTVAIAFANLVASRIMSISMSTTAGARRQTLSPSVVETTAGLSAGCAATLLLHPLDIIKTRLQGKPLTDALHQQH